MTFLVFHFIINFSNKEKVTIAPHDYKNLYNDSFQLPNYDHLFEEEFEDTKGVIRIRILKKNRQHNGRNKKYKRTNNDLQNINIKLKIEQHEPH